MSPQSASKGFTLMEMLVVTAIIGLMTAMAVLSLRVLGSNDSAGDEAKSLARKLVIARDLAELEQRNIGLQIDEAGYEFATFSNRRQTWQALNERSLPASSWPDNIEVILRLDGRPVTLETNTKEIQPQLGVGADGEYTVFELELRANGASRAWVVRPLPSGELALVGPER